MAASCPTNKVPYVTRAEALTSTRHVQGPRQKAYRCVCGFWHTTSGPHKHAHSRRRKTAA